MEYTKILPVSDPNGCDKLHHTRPPSLARIAQNAGVVSQADIRYNYLPLSLQFIWLFYFLRLLCLCQP